MESDDEIDKSVRSWIGSERVDYVADYVARGRKYAELSEEDLSSAWVQSFRNYARNYPG
jgi:hypothetical protein